VTASHINSEGIVPAENKTSKKSIHSSLIRRTFFPRKSYFESCRGRLPSRHPPNPQPNQDNESNNNPQQRPSFSLMFPSLIIFIVRFVNFQLILFSRLWTIPFRAYKLFQAASRNRFCHILFSERDYIIFLLSNYFCPASQRTLSSQVCLAAS